MKKKYVPVYKRLTKGQRAHLREMQVPITLKAIQAEINYLYTNAERISERWAVVCPDCAAIAHRLGIKPTQEVTPT